MDLSEINFRHQVDGEKLVIGIAQDYQTREVLMVAYLNRDALELTLKTGKAHYWSTSRKKIWLKGESSGHLQEVKEIRVDCDADSLLLKIKQKGAACHEGYYSCFFREVDSDPDFALKIIKKKVFEPKKIYGE
ncbi:MAG: phosphoribosyl-AMP cyclohydrolase [Methanobacteriaceae archaeon]|nr:phosphoribosyl-AMP cyclohydrolase [Methanobacteriaceae archaeon]